MLVGMVVGRVTGLGHLYSWRQNSCHTHRMIYGDGQSSHIYGAESNIPPPPEQFLSSNYLGFRSA
eukprot:2848433-Prorocentrum_lima.AAC.1